jgi:hypothetical protein
MAVLTSRLDSSGNFSIASTGVFDEVTGLTGKTTQQNSDGTHLISGLYDEVTLPTTITSFSTYATQFNGTTQRLTTSANSITSQNFTMECWFYMTSNLTYLDGGSYYVARLFGCANVYGFEMLIVGYSAVPTYMTFASAGSAGVNISNPAPITIAINQWHHIAVSRNGTSYALWFDGVRLATSTSSFNFTAGTIYIGAAPNGLYQDWFPGRISNMRIVRGAVVYDPSLTTITVPTAPLTAVASTYLLTCQSATNVDNSGNGFTITPVASPTISAVTVPAIPDVIIPARRQYSNGNYFINGTFDEVTGIDFNYSVVASVPFSGLTEGSTVTFIVFVPNFGSGTLYYTNSGTTSAADFTDGVNSGTVTITDDYGYITKTIATDALIEGTETIIFELRKGSTSGPIVVTADTVSVADNTPSLAGSTLTWNFALSSSTKYDATATFNGTTIVGRNVASSYIINGTTYTTATDNITYGGAVGGSASAGFGSSGGGGGGIGAGTTTYYDFSGRPAVDISGLFAAVTGAGYSSSIFGDGGNGQSAGKFAGGGGGGGGGYSSGNPGTGGNAAIVYQYTAGGTTYYTVINGNNAAGSGSFTFPAGTNAVKIWAIAQGRSGLSGSSSGPGGYGGKSGSVAWASFTS